MKLCSLALSAALCVPVLSGCGSRFDLDDYKADVLASQKNILEATSDLTHVAEYEQSYWQSYIKSSRTSGAPNASDVKDEGFKKSENIYHITYDTVSVAQDSIAQQHKDIILIETDGSEAEQIAALYEELYDNYNDLYELVTSPSGSYNSFCSDVVDYVNAISSTSNELLVFIKD